VSNPELVAAVAEAGGLGILHPTAGMDAAGDPVLNLQENIRHVQRLTNHPFGVTLDLSSPRMSELIEVAIEGNVHIAITYGGSPATYTGDLKDRGMIAMHQVGTVRQARGAETQGVDIVIAEGFEGGGLRSVDKVSTTVLVPQIAASVSIPVVASGGIAESRGYAAALALGAQGVQLGSRFVATRECIAHARYKEAIVAAIDTGTIVVGGDRWPTRLLRNGLALRLKDGEQSSGATDFKTWEEELGAVQARAAMLDGDLEGGIAYCGASAGLISDVLSVRQVFTELVEGMDERIRDLL
jgi:enoyl-[acyl-carrier protein] reductase II